MTEWTLYNNINADWVKAPKGPQTSEGHKWTHQNHFIGHAEQTLFSTQKQLWKGFCDWRVEGKRQCNVWENWPLWHHRGLILVNAEQVAVFSTLRKWPMCWQTFLNFASLPLQLQNPFMQVFSHAEKCSTGEVNLMYKIGGVVLYSALDAVQAHATWRCSDTTKG